MNLKSSFRKFKTFGKMYGCNLGLLLAGEFCHARNMHRVIIHGGDCNGWLQNDKSAWMNPVTTLGEL